MATTSRTAAPAADASAIATRLREASFVRVCSHADGESLAASATLARACDALDVPFQVSAVRTDAAADRRLARAGDGAGDEADARGDETETVGIAVGGEPAGADERLTVAERAALAFDVARELDADPDPILALAGHLAGGHAPAGELLAAAEDAGVDRRSGVGLPVADLADGLAHSTLVHAGFSGDENAAGATLAELGLPAELDDDARRELAAAVALDATDAGDANAASRAANAVERALRPHALPDGPFETAEGYGDVLSALAREAPGLGVALAFGAGDRADALDAWREHATRAHTALRLADPARHSGLVVARVEDADPWTVARLCRDFRSPEPAALVRSDGDAALATTDADARDALSKAVDAESVGGTARLAYAESTGDADLASAVRGAL